MKTRITLISLSIVRICLTLMAQEPPRAAGGGLAERFKQLDRNRDERITREEMSANPFLFDRMDADTNGSASAEELRAYYQRNERLTKPAPPPPAKPSADAWHPHRKSCEPVNGGRGACGRSWFTEQGGDDKDNHTSTWLLGFDKNGQHSGRRLDDRAQTGRAARRHDPDSYLGERELFVYYTLVSAGPSQLHRCRTGISKDKP